MNNIKEIKSSIAYFKDAIRESDEIIADCSPDLQASLKDQKEYFVTALTALNAWNGSSTSSKIASAPVASISSYKALLKGANLSELKVALTELQIKRRSTDIRRKEILSEIQRRKPKGNIE